MKYRAHSLLATTVLITIFCLPLQAQVYKIVDERGRVTYTDQLPPDDQKHETVELEPINTQPPVEPRREPIFVPNEDRNEEQVNYLLALSSPANETHVPPGQRDLRLAAQVSPALRAGHRIQFTMNGQPLGQASQVTSHLIKEIHRGEHRLAVQILDERGRVLTTSDPVTVYVHRPSLNSPNRRAPN